MSKTIESECNACHILLLFGPFHQLPAFLYPHLFSHWFLLADLCLTPSESKLDVILFLFFFFLQSDEEGGKEKDGEEGQQKFIAHVPVPTQQEVRHQETELQTGALAIARYIICSFSDFTL